METWTSTSVTRASGRDHAFQSTNVENVRVPGAPDPLALIPKVCVHGTAAAPAGVPPPTIATAPESTRASTTDPRVSIPMRT
jgi:hypothetical protein